MGIVNTLVEAGKVKFAQSAARADITSQVLVLYAEALDNVRTGERTGLAVQFPELAAAREAETTLVGNAQFFADQLQADGKRASLPEIRTTIIELLHQLKLKALEKDGFVNPLDSMTIECKAKGLESRARAYLVSARMKAEKGTPMNTLLDGVEERMLQDAGQHKVYDEWMRAAQAAITAVKALRIQQLANIVPN